LLDDCLAVHRLVQGIEKTLSSAKATGKFPVFAEEFIRSTLSNGKATRNYLNGVANPVASSEERIKDYRNELEQILLAWIALHDFVKPVMDASILRVPYPLVDLLNLQLSQLTGFSDVKVLVGVTPKLNYYQHRHTRVRGLVGQLMTLIPGCKDYGRIGFVLLCSKHAERQE
jgi:hypothetical protein